MFYANVLKKGGEKNKNSDPTHEKCRIWTDEKCIIQMYINVYLIHTIFIVNVLEL